MTPWSHDCALAFSIILQSCSQSRLQQAATALGLSALLLFCHCRDTPSSTILHHVSSSLISNESHFFVATTHVRPKRIASHETLNPTSSRFTDLEEAGFSGHMWSTFSASSSASFISYRKGCSREDRSIIFGRSGAVEPIQSSPDSSPTLLMLDWCSQWSIDFLLELE